MATQFPTHIVSFLLLIRLFDCQYNYLCDWSTRFTDNNPTTTGTWSFSSSTCTVILTGNDNSGDVSYLSGIPGSNLWSNYNVSVDISIQSGGSNPWPALIFYTQNIADGYWGGNYYALQINKQQSQLVFAWYHNDYNGGTSISIPTINNNQVYNLGVVINGNKFDAYFDGEYKMSWSDSNINTGSVGLRTYGTSSRWNNLYISGIPTPVPTSSPTTTPPPATPTNPTTATPTTAPIVDGVPRIIASPGTWYDDYNDDNPLPGWTYTDDHAGYTNDRITVGLNGKKYHGPYEAISNAGNEDDLYIISQQFYCQKRSSVRVYYNIYSCGTENTDYVRFALNRQQYTIQLSIADGTAYTDSALNAALTKGACTNWLSFGSKGPYIITEIDINRLFTANFTVRLSNPSEGIAISNINITCNPITDVPTTALPTTAIPTINPTTATPTLAAVPRTIASPGTWYDDYDDDNPLPGWAYTDDHAGYANDRITVGINGKQYHGPYEAISNTGTGDDLYTISQQFYCQKRSSVQVFYNIYSCDTENTDYVRLTLNGGTTYTDSALNTALIHI